MYCRVPTELEFMTYVQCGDGREYPWGDNWPPMSGQAGNYCGQEAQGIVSYIHSSMLGRYNDGHVVACDVEKSWANPWGLYGVGGNVEEACGGIYGGEFGAWRGASWKHGNQDALRCSSNHHRGGDLRFSRDDIGGFRLVLSRFSEYWKEKDPVPWTTNR
jgi:formylglycine-generating enzyme required for sulfatase activity